jgi:hypothetical protein
VPQRFAIWVAMPSRVTETAAASKQDHRSLRFETHPPG